MEASKKKNIFQNDKLLALQPWLVLVAAIIYLAWTIIFIGQFSKIYTARIISFFVKAICLFISVKTYKTHNKNVMKAANGFLFGFLLFDNFFELSYANAVNFESVVTVIVTLIYIFMVISHFAFASTHYSNKKLIKLNKFALGLYLVAVVVTFVAFLVYCVIGRIPTFEMVNPFLWLLGTFPTVFAVVSIEVRVNEFKEIREENGYAEK